MRKGPAPHRVGRAVGSRGRAAQRPGGQAFPGPSPGPGVQRQGRPLSLQPSLVPAEFYNHPQIVHQMQPEPSLHTLPPSPLGSPSLPPSHNLPSPGGSGPRMLLGGCSWPHTRASGQASPLPSPRLVLRPREPDGPSRPAQASPLRTLLGPQNPPVPLLRWRPLRGLGTAVRILPLSTVTGGCQAQASRGPAQRRVPGRGACCTPPFPQGRPRSEVLVPPGRRRSLRPSGASSGRAARTAPAGVSGCFPGRAGKHFRQLSLCPLLSP